MNLDEMDRKSDSDLLQSTQRASSFKSKRNFSYAGMGSIVGSIIQDTDGYNDFADETIEELLVYTIREENIDCLSFLNTIEENGFKDRALGSILGAFVGDSCGSFMEFKNYVLTDQEMNECMEMNGGGPFKTAPG